MGKPDFILAELVWGLSEVGSPNRCTRRGTTKQRTLSPFRRKVNKNIPKIVCHGVRISLKFVNFDAQNVFNFEKERF